MKRIEKNIVQSETLERLKRKSVHFPIRLIIGDKIYPGFMTNISKRGVSVYADITFDKELINFNKQSVLKIEFRSPNGELIRLKCKVKWLRIQELSPQNLITSIGMEVLDLSSNFLNLFDQL